MKQSKCKICGKYEVHQKEVKSVKIFDDVEVAVFHMWKWCRLKNNWCRCVAGNCGVVVEKTEKNLKGETNEMLNENE